MLTTELKNADTPCNPCKPARYTSQRWPIQLRVEVRKRKKTMRQ